MAGNLTPAALAGAENVDKSIGFFNDLLGVGWDGMLDGEKPAGGAGNVIFELFYAFNGVILASVMVMFAYVVMTGVIGTAHDGTPLGKRYSTLWTPVRGAFSVSLLMPMPGIKISLIQALVLKFIALSIGGASYLATHTIDFMVSRGAAASIPAAPMVDAQPLANEILRNLVVQEYFARREGAQTKQYSTATKSESDGSLSNIYFDGPIPAAMAVITVSCGNLTPEATRYCADERAAVAQLTTSMRPLASALVSQYADGANTPLAGVTTSGYYEPLKSYAKASQQAATSALAVMAQHKQERVGHFSDEIKNNGWAWLGVYYWQLAKINDDAFRLIAIKSGISRAIDYALVAKSSGAHTELDTVLTRTEEYIANRDAGKVAQQAVTEIADPAGGIAIVNSLLTDALGSTIGRADAEKGAAKLLATTIAIDDPIHNLQMLGHEFIAAGGKVFAGGATTFAAGTLGTWLSGMAKSNVAARVTNTVSHSVRDLGAWVCSIALVLVATGIYLAYYLPALPFMLWIFGIVGWLVLCVEILVAAPVWAAMHAIPEGEGMAGQYGKKGYSLFFGILLRPSLHVMGFFLAFCLTYIAGHYIGEVYQDFAGSTAASDAPSGSIAAIVGWFATLAIGVVITVQAMHKIFGLVTWLPDNILRWAGDSLGSLNEHQDVEKSSARSTLIISETRKTLSEAPRLGTMHHMPAKNQNNAQAHTQGDR